MIHDVKYDPKTGAVPVPDMAQIQTFAQEHLKYAMQWTKTYRTCVVQFQASVVPRSGHGLYITPWRVERFGGNPSRAKGEVTGFGHAYLAETDTESDTMVCLCDAIRASILDLNRMLELRK